MEREKNEEGGLLDGRSSEEEWIEVRCREVKRSGEKCEETELGCGVVLCAMGASHNNIGIL